MDLDQRIRALPSELIHIIRTFLPPHPPRPKPRDNGLNKQLETLRRSPKLTAMALYDLIATPVLRLAGTLLLTYTTHYGASKVYTAVCVPDGWLGFVQGMFTTGSPICTSILSYISNSQSSYATVITATISKSLMDTLLPAA